ncbi:hypothetical protein GOE08_06595 [Sinorhizobium medicae]|nr:hypothetical protein [Sinorhizobium medicae]
MPIGHKLERSPNPTELLLKAREGYQQDLISIAREMQRLEQRRQSIGDRLEDLNRLLGKIDTDGTETVRSNEVDGVALDEERGSDAKEIRAATRNAIEKLGRPVKRADVLKELKKKGIVLSNAEPGKAVNRTLYRSQDVFVRVKEGYVLRERPSENG